MAMGMIREADDTRTRTCTRTHEHEHGRGREREGKATQNLTFCRTAMAMRVASTFQTVGRKAAGALE